MITKYYIPEDETVPESQIATTLEALAVTIAARKDANEESYTYRLLNGDADVPLKKVMEEAGEVALAAKDVEALKAASLAHEDTGVTTPHEALDAALDHLRYEAADVMYHLLVILERYGISLDEFAAELNSRMTDEERPCGAALIKHEHIKRG